MIDQSTSVAAGVTLTIQPGVKVEFNGGSYATLFVNGTVDAVGTAGSPVTFTSYQDASGQGAPGQYMGVNVQSGGSVQFSYVTVQYGGVGSGGYYAYGALAVARGGTASIDHSTFAHNEYSAIQDSGTANVSYSTFTSNGDGVSDINGALSVTHSTVQASGQDGVFFDVTSSTLPGPVMTYDTVTGNASSGVDVEESCSAPVATFPHGEFNNIYGNDPSAEGHAQLATLTNCNALPVDWRNNFWGSDVYYYYNPGACQGTPGDPGHLAYTWSQPPYSAPDGPTGNKRTLLYVGGQYVYCGWDSFGIGPGQFQTSPIAAAGASPGSGSLAPVGAWLFGGGSPAAPNLPVLSCGDPVECGSGDLYETRTDVRVPGLNAGLTFSRTYNSQAAAAATAAGALGYGWSYTFGESLVLDASGALATVTNANGSTVTFTRNSDGSYSAPGFVQASLVRNSDGSYAYTLPDQEAFTFSSAGALQKLTDRNGNATTLAYNASGQLQTVTDPAGRQLSFSYRTGGQIQQITDPAGRTAKYAYDSAGNLTSVTDLAGGVTGYAYDQSHQLTSITDPRGGQVTNTYDSSQRVIAQTDPLGRKRTWSYTAGDTKITDPAGDVTDEQFSGGLPTSITRGYGTPSAATTTISYDTNDNPITVTDAGGHAWTYAYDQAGNQTSSTDPLSRATTRTYDANRDVTSLTLPSGHLTSYGYDQNGNLTSTTTTLVETGQQQSTTMTYNTQGELTKETNPLGKSWTYGYDSDGDRTSATSPLGHQTTWSYDQVGRLTSTTSARGNQPGANSAAYTTTFTTDAFGNPLTVTDPTGNQTTYAYDADQNLTDVTDRDGRHTHYTYDLDNELTKTTRPDGSTLLTGYDRDGQVQSQTDGLGNATTYGRDPLERTISITDPNGRQTTIGYDAAGNQTTLTNPAGQTTTNTYDAADQLTAVSYSSANPGPVTYSYDADGLRTKTTDETGTTSYGYDSLDRLISSTSGAGQTTTYGYDLANQLTSIGYPAALTPLNLGGTGTQQQIPEGTVTRGYDADGNLTSVSDWLGNSTSFAYDPENNLTGVTRPNGTTASYGYDLNNAITSLTDTGAQVAYGRSNEGLLTSATMSGQNPQNDSYDPAARLTGTAGNTYSYDAADNPTQTNTGGGQPVAQTFDPANQLQTSTQAQTTTSYGYDPNGNRTTTTPAGGQPTTYTYDQANQLIAYNGPDHTSTTAQTANDQYTYTADGLRQTKTYNNILTNEAWDLADTLPLMIEDGPTAYITGPGGLAIEQITQNGTVSYYSHDQQGSTTALTDQNGNTTATYTYNPYGNPTSTPPTGTTTPFGYDGQYTDPETGLQYLRARYYDPATAQFLTRDPIEALTRQPYSYVYDNPLNGTDPTGLDCGVFDPGGCVNDLAGTDVGGDAVNFVVQNSGTIATVASAAALVPGVDVVAGPIAIGAGLVQGGKDVASGNYVGAAVDAFGVGSGLAAAGLKAGAEAWAATESNLWSRGWMQPWAADEAAAAAARYGRLSFGAFAAGSVFGPLINPDTAAGAAWCGL